MEKAIVYTQTLDPRVIEAALGDWEIRKVASRAELAEALVRETDVLCVVAQVAAIDGEFEGFLSSLKRSMARLNLAVVCDSCREAVPEVFTHILANPETLDRDLRSYVSSVVLRNRRTANRYDWPLEGFVSLDGKRWESHRVRSLSSNGAFLESDAAAPRPGSRVLLRVVFQDFKMLATCEVLDARLASSRLPAGFGLRFVDFSSASRAVIDRIVDDALVRSLLAPDEGDGAPSLGDEGFTLGPELR